MTFMSASGFKGEAWNHHWLTPSHNFATNAEAANNYINGSEVGEDHTALSDTAIEAGIYRYILENYGFSSLEACFNKHGKTWQAVNDLGRESAYKWAISNGFSPNH